MAPEAIYRTAAPPNPTVFCLRQGEILTGLVRTVLDISTLGSPQPKHHEIAPRYAVLLTQDCDLEQDFQAREEGQLTDKRLPNLLFCEAAPASEMYGPLKKANNRLYSRIVINKDERYHFLQAVPTAADALNDGLPELGIDFKRYFSMPTDEVYKRIELREAQPRAILLSPYMEHLSKRFAFYLSRVALPQDHVSV